jgi:phosphoribosyl-ATP pyrophosphohydrolase
MSPAFMPRGWARSPRKWAKKVSRRSSPRFRAADELVGEAADLVFHLMVLLGARDVPFARVLAELDRREGLSGLAEKAARPRD